nr:hypothetical protein [Tanacetum cinerariifolium]
MALHLYNSGLKSTALNLDVYGTELTMDMFRETVNQNHKTKITDTRTLKNSHHEEHNFSLDYKITAEAGVVTEGEGSDPCLTGRDAHRLLYIVDLMLVTTGLSGGAEEVHILEVLFLQLGYAINNL